MDKPTTRDIKILEEQVRETIRRVKSAPLTSKLGRMRQRAKTKLTETCIEELLHEKPIELR